ncbi:MAG: hypothetical protein U5L11_05245 [Arhodomonas sp.]|nr:hypothetical protein [Arhodomonas sp.]
MPEPAWLQRWIRRRHGDTGGRTRLSYHRLYILPTRQGWGFALLVVLMWLGATNYQLNLGFILTFLLAGIGIAAMHHCYRNLWGLTLLPAAPAPAFAGETARYPVVLLNPAPRRRIAVALDAGAAPVHCDVPDGGEISALVPCPVVRRGCYRPGRVRVTTVHPTGLFRTWSWIEPSIELVVYPRPEQEPPPLPEEPGGEAQGSPAQRPGDEDFHGLRRVSPPIR